MSAITPVIKLEHGTSTQVVNGAGPNIKSEPDLGGISPGGRSDEDIYEDAGDLDFTDSSQEIYLTRIPKFLWKAWSTLEADDEIHLGTIRLEGDVEKPKRMSLLLSSDVSANDEIPKEYKMPITNWEPANTFIFTEKDLPGYNSKAKSSSRPDQDSGSLPFSQVAPRNSVLDRAKPSQPTFDRNKKWQPYYKKAIPKKTAMSGQVRREINCLPVENLEYRELMESRKTLEVKRETRFLTGNTGSLGGSLLNPGTLGALGTFSTFIKTATATKGKGSDLKAARIPQNELLDLIHECFKRYKYWSLKSLKAEVNQPEAYLKLTLEKVAHLVRQGPHALTYQLNQDNSNAQLYDAMQEDTAPDTGYGFDGVSDTGEGKDSDDDDNMKLEDVMSQ